MSSPWGRDLLEGINVNSPDRRLIQYPRGMHICDYQHQPGFKTWYAFGIPRNKYIFNLHLLTLLLPFLSD